MSSPVETFLGDSYAEKREPRVNGVLTAKVTGRMPDGAYELQYLSMGRNAPSAPARAMAPTAGAKRGFFAMPEVGDEVVVAFDGGDTNMPIILGAVWNGESQTPDQAKPSDDNNIRTFVSRSGHELTFDDETAAGKVTLRSKQGHEVQLDDTPPGKISISGPTGALIELDDATGTLTIRSPLAIKLETATLTLGAGSVAMGPPSPASGVSAPPAPTVIQSPLLVELVSNVAISLRAPTILLTTTGTAPTSLVVIDGKPFGLHTHLPIGTVAP